MRKKGVFEKMKYLNKENLEKKNDIKKKKKKKRKRK